MFITKKHIPRRTVLRGAGATLALPLLDAMVPAATVLAQTAADAEAAVRRLLRAARHGARLLGAGQEGALAAELPFIFKPLEPFREQTVILSGLHSRSAEPPPGVTGADHWVAAAFLCANKPKKTAGADVYAGTTIDQMIAQKIGQDNLMPSMQLAVEDPGANSSNCGEGYSCTYTNTISWSSPTHAAADGAEPAGGVRAHVRRRQHGRAARRAPQARPEHPRLADAAACRACAATSSAADRARLDDYARERPRDRAAAADRDEGVDRRARRTSTVPVGVPQTFDEHIKLQFDLLALAFQADITRVGTLLFARDLTGRTYPESEAPTVGFHGGSHHGEDPRRIAELSKINQYHVKMLAYFVDRLAKTQDGDGTLLDHSLVLYGSNMGNSNQHVHYDVPHVLVGGANGKLKGGRHLAYPTKTVPTGNLLLSVLDKFDIHQDSIGDSTGRLEDSVRDSARLRSPKIHETCDGCRGAVAAVVLFAGHGRRSSARRQTDVADAAMRGDTAAVRALLDAEGRRERAAGRRRDGAALGGLPRRRANWRTC